MSKTIAYETAAGPQQVDAAHPLPVNATVTATANTVATATAAAPSYVEGTVNPLSMDLTGGMRITGTINATSAAKATTAAPSYTNNTDNSFSQNLTGDLRVIAKQSGAWVVSAGSAIIGQVSIDQTTNGVTNAVDVLNMPVTLDVNSGVKSNSTIRVTLATDQVQLTNALKVDPSAVTSPVSAASLPLPTGAATAAKQPALGTAGTSSADVITVQGRASMTALVVDGSAVTQPVSIAATVTSKEVRSATGTRTSVAGSASSVTLLASNASRLGATIFNDSTQILYADLSGGTASSSAFTYKMNPGDTLETPANYTGLITGIWASANGNARVTEFT